MATESLVILFVALPLLVTALLSVTFGLFILSGEFEYPSKLQRVATGVGLLLVTFLTSLTITTLMEGGL